MTVPEPDFGPVPSEETGLRPPEQFVPARPFSMEEEDEGDFGELPPEVEEPQAEEITELSERELGLFRQLITVGQRSKTVDVLGHTVVVQNLRVSDDLRIGLYCRDYEGTKMEQRAYQLAVCAAGIKTVNGNPIYQPLTGAEGEDEIFRVKAEKLKDYYPVVITRIYRAIMDLDQEFVELAVKLGKLEG
jgi:hypothetical protein